MIHISFAFLSLSYLRVTPGRGRGAGVSEPGVSPTLATETVPHPSQQDIIRARARRHQQHYLFTCQGPDDNDRGKCANIVPGQRPVTCQVSPGVQPDRYSIFIFKIPQIPEFTLTNFLKLVVLIISMLIHYHFIVARFKTANEEAVKVLESLPDPE